MAVKINMSYYPNYQLCYYKHQVHQMLIYTVLLGRIFCCKIKHFFQASKCGAVKSDKYSLHQCNQIRLSFSPTFCDKNGIDAVTGHLLLHLVQICANKMYFMLAIQICVNTKCNFGWSCWITFSFLFSLRCHLAFHWKCKHQHVPTDSCWKRFSHFTFQLPRSKSSICNPSCWPLHICKTRPRPAFGRLGLGRSSGGFGSYGKPDPTCLMPRQCD